MTTDGLTARHAPGASDTLVLASPANRNALSERLLLALADRVRQARTSDARVLVLDHDGPAFCSGVDIKERAAAGDDAPHSTLLAALLTDLWTFPKPVLAAVHGTVRGGGMALLACCDLVVASPDSSFAYTETRVGVVPALVAAVTFPRLPASAIGPLMLTGNTFDAAEATRTGVATRTADNPTDAVNDEAQAILHGAPDAVARTKQLLKGPVTPTVLEALRALERDSRAAFRSPEAREGMAAFQERRPPAWAP